MFRGHWATRASPFPSPEPMSISRDSLPRSTPLRPLEGPAHLSRRRPRLPATSASCRQPRPSGARSKLSLSLRSSGSGRRLRVAPAGGEIEGPGDAVGGCCTARGGEACSGCPHSDMATPVASTAQLPPVTSGLGVRAPSACLPGCRRSGRRSRRTARPSQEEALLPGRETGSL